MTATATAIATGAWRPGALALGAAATALLVSACGAQNGASAAGSPVAPEAGTAEPGAAAPAPAVTSVGDRVGVPCPASNPNPRLVPDGLPGITLECLGPGPDVNLAGLTGTPAVINVWASWCPPCRAEMPDIAALAADAGDSLIVLGVDVQDDRTAGMEFAAQAPIASVYDPNSSTRATLGWTGPPITLFVAADGTVVHRTYGAVADGQTLRADVKRYLGVEVSAQ